MPCRNCDQSNTVIDGYNREVETYGVVLFDFKSTRFNAVYLSCKQCYEDGIHTRMAKGLLIKRRIY